jgi:transcriptional regulator with XRE-family HTH domain
MPFAENLRYELDCQELFVKELATKTGININTLNHYLSGRKSMPPADIAVKIAEVLGVSVEYLVTGVAYKEMRIQQTDQTYLMEKIQKYVAFHETIEHLSALPEIILKPIKAMIKTAADLELRKQKKNSAES